MSRPVRIEFPNALYHVTARGDRRENIFEDDEDRQMFLSVLEQVIGQFN
jgi:REP element-mobilizing transposase RayT